MYIFNIHIYNYIYINTYYVYTHDMHAYVIPHSQPATTRLNLWTNLRYSIPPKSKQ